MKSKTSITLSAKVLENLDRVIDRAENRSIVIERAIEEYLHKLKREEDYRRELALLNRHAKKLNREAAECSLLPGRAVNRGELYRVFRKSGPDPGKSRVFVVVSRQAVIDSSFSTVVCAPIYSERHGLATQVNVGLEDGLKHESCVHCDELISLPKVALTNYVGSLSEAKLHGLRVALRIALDAD